MIAGLSLGQVIADNSNKPWKRPPRPPKARQKRPAVKVAPGLPKNRISHKPIDVAMRSLEYAALRDKGLSLSEIGRRFLVHHTTVSYALNKMNYKRKPMSFEEANGIW